MTTRRHLLRLLPAAGLAAACRPKEPTSRHHLPDQPLRAVTSTVQAADLVRQVGGAAVEVRSLIPAGANPHLWQPTAADYVAIQTADVFILSGLGLESHFQENLKTLREQGLVVGVLANGLAEQDILKGASEKPQPHFWMNPLLWAKAAAEVGAVLAEASPPTLSWFSDRAHEYGTELARLHQEMARRLAVIPTRSRFLLSSHDSMAYFGKAYGLETRGLCHQGDPIPEKPNADLSDWVADHRVRTLFREHFVPAAALLPLSRQLKLLGELPIFSLSLAAPGTRLPGASNELKVDSYLPALRYTAEAILGRLKDE